MNRITKLMLVCAVVAGSVISYDAFARDTREVYVGQGRYTCVGDRSACRGFEAQERARQDDRRYQNERLEQERRRERREEREDREYRR